MLGWTNNYTKVVVLALALFLQKLCGSLEDSRRANCFSRTELVQRQSRHCGRKDNSKTAVAPTQNEAQCCGSELC